MKELFESIITAMEEKRNTVLVSLVSTAGSTPREAGAHMLVDQKGIVWGTVGGGPMEGRALELCRQVLAEEQGCVETIVLRDDTPGGLEAVCGGEGTMFLRFLHCEDTGVRDAAELAVSLLNEHIPCWLILENPESDGFSGSVGERTVDTSISDVGRSTGFSVHDVARTTGFSVRGGGRTAGARIPDEVLKNMPEEAALVGEGEEQCFVQPLLQKERVFIFGGGHVAQALVPTLAGVGFRCIITDDREEFCSPALFPGVEETYHMALDAWQDTHHITKDDFICVMTRGHQKDINCIDLALHTPAKYIGLMGSRRKIKYTEETLRQRGFTDTDIARITTPIGLPILAETPAEIAISIAAQLIRVRAGGDA